MADIKNILESLIFVSEEPLSVSRIKKVLPDADGTEIRQGLTSLIEEYDARDGGFYLREIAGGYQFRSAPAYREYVLRLIQPNPIRLSKAALEALAIIAYRQPAIRSDIEHIRGVDSGGVLRLLLERKLVRILGRKEIPGRPLIYGTTKQFLEIFDLKSLRDLPSLKEIEDMGSRVPETAEQNPPDADEAPGPDIESGPETETALEPEPDPGPDAFADMNPDAVPDTIPDSVPDINPDSVSDSGPNAEPASDSVTEAEDEENPTNNP